VRKLNKNSINNENGINKNYTVSDVASEIIITLKELQPFYRYKFNLHTGEQIKTMQLETSNNTDKK